ncbi:hypothetical protein XENOCAPTIV_018137, partial [Xenoophorus captivus]
LLRCTPGGRRRGATSGGQGISWSIKEMASANQRTDREPAFPKISTQTPSLNKSQSGLSLSSLFKVLGDSSLRLYTPELRKPKSEYKAVSLEKFRSLQDKLLLLDLAVAAHDGNAITAVKL